ncbi:MAG: DUF433 domain-containing protein [Myxococcales bacterium]|nr:DUF433 domain-containing protein [Myxococcales bacterium]MCB9522611.1 DUF433 domain-containing protein [Myxococcales bacterium]
MTATAQTTYLDGRIRLDPAVCNGRPTINGTRITVQTVLEFLGAGDSEADVLEAFPALSSEDIRACLRFAATVMNHRYRLARVA